MKMAVLGAYLPLVGLCWSVFGSSPAFAQSASAKQSAPAAPSAAPSAAPPSAATQSAAAQAMPVIAEGAWVRATPGADVAAAYLTLRNTSAKPIVVTGVHSPLAAHAMIHETSLEGGQSRMRAREQVVLAPGQTLKFEPGGLHIMLSGLKQPLTMSLGVPLVIELAGGTAIQVTAPVRPMGML